MQIGDDLNGPNEHYQMIEFWIILLFLLNCPTCKLGLRVDTNCAYVCALASMCACGDGVSVCVPPSQLWCPLLDLPFWIRHCVGSPRNRHYPIIPGRMLNILQTMFYIKFRILKLDKMNELEKVI